MPFGKRLLGVLKKPSVCILDVKQSVKSDDNKTITETLHEDLQALLRILGYFETSVTIYQTTHSNIAEDLILKLTIEHLLKKNPFLQDTNATPVFKTACQTSWKEQRYSLLCPFHQGI